MSTETEAGITDTSTGRRKPRRGLLLLALVLVATGGVAWYMTRDSGQDPADQPLIVAVEIGDIENTITAAGTLKPRNYVDVGAQVSGQLQKLYVDVGDVVEEGQLLAEIDARQQQNRVEASRASLEGQEAQLEARRASLDLARANAQRQERLKEANATSQQDYDTAIANLAGAESNLIQLQKQIEQSRASLESDETELEFTRIYAPTAGTVVSVEMTEGRTLNASQQAPTILRIADLDTMSVETAISEADIGDIKKGMPVYFTTLGGGERRWYSELRQILPTPVTESNVVLYTGLFDVDNSDRLLLPEMTAQVYFITASAEDVLKVPLGALSFSQAQGPESAAGGLAAKSAGRVPPDGGFQPSEGFVRPEGFMSPNGRAGQAGPAGGEEGNQGRRLATVQLVRDDGTTESKEVIVGVTSRVAAEVVAGLSIGDKVVAGIQQPMAQGEGDDDFRGPPFRRMGGW